jgi:hypothetical protein
MTILLQGQVFIPEGLFQGHAFLGEGFCGHNRIVIPTGADPEFLHRGTQQRPAYAAFRRESRMKFANATKLDRKSGVA